MMCTEPLDVRSIRSIIATLAAAGAGLVELQQAGDWKAPQMPARYARHQLAARGAVAKLRYQAGQ